MVPPCCLAATLHLTAGLDGEHQSLLTHMIQGYSGKSLGLHAEQHRILRGICSLQNFPSSTRGWAIHLPNVGCASWAHETAGSNGLTMALAYAVMAGAGLIGKPCDKGAEESGLTGSCVKRLIRENAEL